MTELEAIIALNMIDIGYKRLERLLKYFGKPENIFTASREKLSEIEGIPEIIAQKILDFKKQIIDKELGFIKRNNLKLITIFDKGYPACLKEIYSPPILLYMRGKIIPEDEFSIAMVGSRQASFYGLSCAERFSAKLSQLGLTIVSGLALGIDTHSHLGALKVKGRTIAVMGSGFNYIYPYRNKKILERIANNGAVISEFSCDTKPWPTNFPRRNRIISGLVKGVLIVEAARNSGALITADFALEQGREVFCLPGKIDSQTSFGTHALIKQGAKLVSNIEDILEELNIKVAVQPDINNKQVRIKPKLSEEEKLLYNLISNEPLALDSILERSKLNLPLVMHSLLNLEIKGFIQQRAGRQFVKEL